MGFALSWVPWLRRVLFAPFRDTLVSEARLSEFDNYNVETKVLARSKASTFVVTDDPSQHSDQTISVADGEKCAKLQNQYITGQDLLLTHGFIGNEPPFRPPARLTIDHRNANLPAQQTAT